MPGGYTISRVSLEHLLTAVEYRGYCTHGEMDKATKKNAFREVLLDADGKPQQFHEAIVSEDDWNYAFNRLSWETLTGEDNKQRVDAKSGWVPSTKVSSNFLHGILTSTQGTVRYSSGIYNVAELRDGHSQRSNTLSVPAPLLDKLFSKRLASRLVEMQASGKTEYLQDKLATIKQKNAKALATVGGQLIRARKEKAGIDAFIKAVGSTASTATLVQYNNDLLELEATIKELEDKKNAANVEESGIGELIQLCSDIRQNALDNSRRFVNLACDRVSLDEYSSHFITLTIVWSAPFSQVDICYIYREDGGRQEWTEADQFDLSMLYPLVDRKAILERFPSRSWLGITSWANDRKWIRDTKANSSGITDRVLSLKDHELLQEHGWDLDQEDRVYWLYDVSTDSSSPVTSSGSSRYS